MESRCLPPDDAFWNAIMTGSDESFSIFEENKGTYDFEAVARFESTKNMFPLDPNCRNPQYIWITPFHLAAALGREKVVTFLVESGCVPVDVLSSHSSCTALSLATRYGHQSLAEYLISSGAKTDAPAGYTAFHTATAAGLHGIMEKLATENPELVEKLDIDDADCYKYATLSPTPIETKKVLERLCNVERAARPKYSVAGEFNRGI